LDWVTTEKHDDTLPATQLAKINGGWMIRTFFWYYSSYKIEGCNTNMVFISDPSHVLFVNHDKEDA